jgi:hypothetical protein
MAPDQAGSFEMTTHVSSLVAGSPTLLQALSTPLVIEKKIQGMIEDTIAALNPMDFNWYQKKKIRYAIKLLERIGNRGIDCKKDIEKNIRDLLTVAEIVTKAENTDETDIRFQIDALLSIQMTAFYCFNL